MAKTINKTNEGKKPARKYAVQKGTLAKLDRALGVLEVNDELAHTLNEEERAALAKAHEEVGKAVSIARFPLGWYAYKWVLDVAARYGEPCLARTQA